MVERLCTRKRSYSALEWQDDIEDNQWLELLHPFTGVKKLYLSKEFASRIAPSLQDLVGRRRKEVLPALECLFLEELHPSGSAEPRVRMYDYSTSTPNDTATVAISSLKALLDGTFDVSFTSPYRIIK